MEDKKDTLFVRLFGSSVSYMRRYLFRVLSVGPVPNHLAFILDGNRRYSRKWNLGEGMGHRAGFLSLMSLMKYCYELGVKYVTIYAFSIDNFRRKPQEVEYVMDLMLEKIQGLLNEETTLKQYGVRVYFIGTLKLLNERVREAAEKAMKVTANNNGSIVLLICVAYTSTDEILHAVQDSCEELESFITPQMETDPKKKQQEDEKDVIKLSDIEKHMYMGMAPDPDVLVRTSGETRLSNYLLWQTSNTILYSPTALWPEIGFRHLVWAVIDFQRMHPYFQRRKKEGALMIDSTK